MRTDGQLWQRITEASRVKGTARLVEHGAEGTRSFTQGHTHDAGPVTCRCFGVVEATRPEFPGPPDDVGMGRQLAQQFQAKEPCFRSFTRVPGQYRSQTRGNHHGIHLAELTDQEFATGALILGHGGEAGFEQGVAVPDVVIQIGRVHGQHRIVHDSGTAQSTAKFRDGHSGSDARREAQDHVVEAARGEAFRRRDYVKPDGAAEATMLQDRGFAFEQLAVPVDASKDQGTVQQIVEDHHGVPMGPAKPCGGCLAALAVQGTDYCEVHGTESNANSSH